MKFTKHIKWQTAATTAPYMEMPEKRDFYPLNLIQADQKKGRNSIFIPRKASSTVRETAGARDVFICAKRTQFFRDQPTFQRDRSKAVSHRHTPPIPVEKPKILCPLIFEVILFLILRIS